MILFHLASQTADDEMFRNILSLLTLVLSIINLIYAAFIFAYKNKKDDRLKEKDIRASAFYNLIISPNIGIFYDFFNLIEHELRKLRDPELSMDEKLRINEFVKDQMSHLRLRFIDLFRAVSYRLYSRSITSLDKLVDQITNDIFDEKVDLSDSDVFQDRVLRRLSLCRTSIVTQMHGFDGSEDPVDSYRLSVTPPTTHAY